MSECTYGEHEFGSAWTHCPRCRDKKNDLVAAANRVAALAEGRRPKISCHMNEHQFVIGNADNIRCEHCGVSCNGENLAALGFVHRSNVRREEGLDWLRAPMADAYRVTSWWFPTEHAFKIRLEDVKPEPADEEPTQFETACRTCSKPNDIGVKVCWCCGNAP